MTFNQLKEYHLKELSIILDCGKELKGIITSHHWDERNTFIVSVTVVTLDSIERIQCDKITGIEIIGEVKLKGWK